MTDDLSIDEIFAEAPKIIAEAPKIIAEAPKIIASVIKAKKPKNPRRKTVVELTKLPKQSASKAARKRTQEGYPIYTLNELNIGNGGDTKLCPFDCTCCF